MNTPLVYTFGTREFGKDLWQRDESIKYHLSRCFSMPEQYIIAGKHLFYRASASPQFSSMTSFSLLTPLKTLLSKISRMLDELHASQDKLNCLD